MNCRSHEACVPLPHALCTITEASVEVGHVCARKQGKESSSQFKYVLSVFEGNKPLYVNINHPFEKYLQLPKHTETEERPSFTSSQGPFVAGLLDASRTPFPPHSVCCSVQHTGSAELHSTLRAHGPEAAILSTTTETVPRHTPTKRTPGWPGILAHS